MVRKNDERKALEQMNKNWKKIYRKQKISQTERGPNLMLCLVFSSSSSIAVKAIFSSTSGSFVLMLCIFSSSSSIVIWPCQKVTNRRYCHN